MYCVEAMLLQYLLDGREMVSAERERERALKGPGQITGPQQHTHNIIAVLSLQKMLMSRRKSLFRIKIGL